QHVFFLNIAKNEGISQKDLTNLVMIDKATTAKALKKLEEHGYIYRQCNQRDRRYNQLFLTEKGHEMMPIITSILMEITEELAAGMTEDEIQYFSTFLDKMLNNAVEVVEFLRSENK
ncbi:MAG: MarR family transcriptional regulator, partial [Turicibacter sp.]|nr:MarR family transcriptional regulator [Turicibacter sp.]